MKLDRQNGKENAKKFQQISVQNDTKLIINILYPKLFFKEDPKSFRLKEAID